VVKIRWYILPIIFLAGIILALVGGYFLKYRPDTGALSTELAELRAEWAADSASWIERLRELQERHADDIARIDALEASVRKRIERERELEGIVEESRRRRIEAQQRLDDFLRAGFAGIGDAEAALERIGRFGELAARGLGIQTDRVRQGAEEGAGYGENP